MDAPRPQPLAYPDPPLTDGVIGLRGWRYDDVPAIVRMCSDELSARFTTVPAPYGEEDARTWLESHPESRAAGRSIAFAVLELPSDQPVASLGLRIVDPGMAEVGYLADPAVRGRGIVTRGVGLICGWAFGELGLERVQLTTHPDNRSSQRVAEKCGFRCEGTLRRYGVRRGERVDLMMWGRLRDDGSEQGGQAPLFGGVDS
ncbi:MAG TPA: GNAT family protein [Gaiellales bacterium]|jgi:RimJ/RimL family protein N-acetyltransferase|nr:GNAT family protein [Gaiellales bacterium]